MTGTKQKTNTMNKHYFKIPFYRDDFTKKNRSVFEKQRLFVHNTQMKALRYDFVCKYI
jgi:hypothetical protein